MAVPAGTVNRAGLSNDGPFREVIASSSEEIQELADAVRELVYDVLPGTVEVVWTTEPRSAGEPARRSSPSSSPI